MPNSNPKKLKVAILNNTATWGEETGYSKDGAIDASQSASQLAS